MPVLDIERIYTRKEDREEYARASRGLSWLELSDRIRALEKFFNFRNVKAVISFLSEHPFLIAFLREAYTAIEQSFGRDPQIEIEIVADPEVPGLVQMFGYIVSSLGPEEAGERLQRFDRSWFLKQLPRVKGLTNFDLEFV